MKKRIDVLLVDMGFFPSREQARRTIMAGNVFVDNQRVDKPGTMIKDGSDILVKGKPLAYVSRGGLKLEKAMKNFDLSLDGKVCMDIGASTGGFTDCMLQNGAVLKRRTSTYKLFTFLLLCLMMAGSMNVHAQKARNRRMGIKTDSIIQVKDSLVIDSLKLLEERQKIENMEAPVDTAALVRKNDSIQKAMAAETKPRFIPNSNRAIWLALVIPGGGQIYNRKYWKLPIVYGGFVGCAYALTWNNRMYKDYSQAYLDIMDDDPDTKSYEDFLPHGMSAEGMEDTFKKRKDFYRRNRDLSIFCFIGVYILSVIDAYVDAELSDFDISKDLGLQIQPVIFNDGRSRIPNTIGLQCSFKF